MKKIFIALVTAIIFLPTSVMAIGVETKSGNQTIFNPQVSDSIQLTASLQETASPQQTSSPQVTQSLQQ